MRGKPVVSKIVAFVGALLMLGSPAIAHAQRQGSIRMDPNEPPCGVEVTKLCAPAAFRAEALWPALPEMSPDELRYHRETVEHMSRAASIPVPSTVVKALTQAEFLYHRETTAHMNRAASVVGATISIRPMTAAELAYHRDTVRHMHER